MTEPAALETPFEFEVDEGTTESWDFEEGEEIVPDRFALKKLGGGTDYEAYLAWDEHLASLLVAKVLRPHLVGNEGAEKSLAREAGALSHLRHPLLVRGFGAVLKGPRPHVLMEHLEGPHLARLIRRYGPLPLDQFVPLAINLFSVAHYLSREGMVHLDIKPRNIVVGVPPRLIDLSIARSLSRAERINGHVGTDLYMAPEQCESNKHFKIGPPADVWGIGATLYHAISGQRPFERPKDYDDSDLQQRFPQIRHEAEPLNTKKIPALVADPTMRCLRRDPAERPTAREAMDLLEPALAALPRKHRLGRLRPRLG
jgi:serine/threonine protein kinase